MTDKNYSKASHYEGRQTHEANKKLSLHYIRNFISNQIPEQLFTIHYALGNREDSTPSILVNFRDVKVDKIEEIKSSLADRLETVSGDNVLKSAIRINGYPTDIIKRLEKADNEGLKNIKYSYSTTWVLK